MQASKLITAALVAALTGQAIGIMLEAPNIDIIVNNSDGDPLTIDNTNT